MIAGLRRQKIVLMSKKFVHVPLSHDLLMSLKKTGKISACLFLTILHNMRKFLVQVVMFLEIYILWDVMMCRQASSCTNSCYSLQLLALATSRTA
jgi:hypothetical protein